MESSGFESSEINLFQISEKVTAEALRSGGMSECFRVKFSGRQLFMKRLRKELRDMPVYEASLRKEFEVGFALDHKGLPRYVAYGRDNIGSYLLMDWIRGVTLDVFVNSRGSAFRNESFAERILFELLDATEYLHSNSILHLDLKPANIMITTVGQTVKIVDLGCAFSDTYCDTPGGTPEYQAPEMDRSHATSDIYSIGRIMQFVNDKTNAYCSRAYRKIIACATAANPSERYQSVAQMRAAIDAIALHRHAVHRAIIGTVAFILIACAVYGTTNFITNADYVANPSIADADSTIVSTTKTVADSVTLGVATTDTATTPEPAKLVAAVSPAKVTDRTENVQDLARQQLKNMREEIIAQLPSMLEKYHPYYRDTHYSNREEYDAAGGYTRRYIADLGSVNKELAEYANNLADKYPLVGLETTNLLLHKGQSNIFQHFIAEFAANNTEYIPANTVNAPTVSLRDAIYN
jgi:serine/threonine protein kinase